MAIMVMTILTFELNRGLNQTKGKASGPKHKKLMINTDGLKNHFSCLVCGLLRNSLQNRHFFASS